MTKISRRTAILSSLLTAGATTCIEKSMAQPVLESLALDDLPPLHTLYSR